MTNGDDHSSLTQLCWFTPHTHDTFLPRYFSEWICTHTLMRDRTFSRQIILSFRPQRHKPHPMRPCSRGCKISINLKINTGSHFWQSVLRVSKSKLLQERMNIVLKRWQTVLMSIIKNGIPLSEIKNRRNEQNLIFKTTFSLYFYSVE